MNAPTLSRTVAVLAAALLAASPAFAGDRAKTDDPNPGFNALDKDNDGSLSRTEAARVPELGNRFGEVDADKDGKLSRAEYLKVMTRQDFRSLREKVADFIDPSTDKDRPAGK